VKEAGIESPAIIIVGEVVELRERIAWFEKRPLFGKRILVTRAREQASELVRRIEELGGEAVEFPVIRCQTPSKKEAIEQLDEALSSLNKFHWVLFTSVNGVDFFFRRLMENGLDIRSLSGAIIAAVGPKTQEALRQRGLTTLPLPAEYQAEGLAESLFPHLKPGQHVLIPSGDLARDVLPKKLAELGMQVTQVDTYETVLSTEYGEETLEMLRSESINAVTFTSSSTVTNLLVALRQLGEEQPEELINRLEVTCIGPITAKTAKDAGLTVHRVAQQSTVASMIEALQQPL
jgi:uroporphyrinogen III methyltransferase/synthase